MIREHARTKSMPRGPDWNALANPLYLPQYWPEDIATHSLCEPGEPRSVPAGVGSAYVRILTPLPAAGSTSGIGVVLAAIMPGLIIHYKIHREAIRRAGVRGRFQVPSAAQSADGSGEFGHQYLLRCPDSGRDRVAPRGSSI
jgi:hypothetical protein